MLFGEFSHARTANGLKQDSGVRFDESAERRESDAHTEYLGVESNRGLAIDGNDSNCCEGTGDEEQAHSGEPSVLSV